MFEFICEVCGKECTSQTDPSTWKQGKICWDCRKNKSAQTKTSATQSTSNGYSKATNINSYRKSTTEFDLSNYIDELLTVYQTLKEKAFEAGLDIPETNLCQWTTSILIQKDKR